MRRSFTLAATLALVAGTAPLHAEPALDSLVPLLEVFGSGGAIPGYDVVGIRCGGLFTAQLEWARQHPGAPMPDARQIAGVESFLERAEAGRRAAGQDYAMAYNSTLTDVQRVIALYTERFGAYATAGHDPFRSDPVVIGDTNYCNAANEG